MATPKRTVLITGCSDGGLGAGLAEAFHKAGLHVYATARNPSKMKNLKALGIETLKLDVLSESSIAACVAQISSLDILINNAGASYSMPISDLSIPEAKELFDLNVWSYLSVTQAFLPLLLKSKGMIANNTSIAGSVTVPFQATYNASKAAIAMFTDTLRLELQPFSVKVIDLKTGSTKSNIQLNTHAGQKPKIPADSIYSPAREVVEKSMGSEEFMKNAMDQTKWSDATVKDLLKPTPPSNIWRGDNAWLVRLSTVLPFGLFDNMIKKMSGLDIVAQIIGK